MTMQSAVGDRFLRESDAFSWHMEEDPVLRSTVIAIAWLDRSPRWELFLARLERATRMVPMFRQCVVEAPNRLGPPRWALDPGFDLHWHVSRVRAPEPRDEATVLDVAAREAMTGFDRSRPLWSMILVDGLAGDRAALVMKLHHSLTDGLGGVQLALNLFDTKRSTGALPMPPIPHVASAGLARAVADRAGSSVGLLVRRLRSAVPDTLGMVGHPARSIRAGARDAASVARTVAPVWDTLSPIMRERGLNRRLASFEVPVDRLKAASAAAGGSLNDGFLAAVTGGLRLYHDRHRAPVDMLRVTMPISIRHPDDPIGGNRITLMRFALPVADPDPIRRIRAAGVAARRAREEPSLAWTDAIAGVLNLLPTPVVAAMLKHVDFLASNVPGFTQTIYLAGAEVERYGAFGPTTGTAANITLLSYRGSCHVGINVDTAAIPDTGEFSRCMREGFDEVMALAGS